AYEVTPSTIRYNVKKIVEAGSIDHKGGNGRANKITKNIAKIIGQYIRKNNTISVHKIANKLEARNIRVSYRTICKYMKS
ncbi:13044_t:CDS:1, partial [Acaulospora morrowiae]